MSSDPATLTGLLDTLWRQLHDGVRNANSPARHIALATARAEGGAAVRTLVLRGADKSKRTLTFYTHLRSQKITQLADDPVAEVLLWDAQSQVQARFSVEIVVTPGSANLWRNLGSGSRLNYARDPIPGDEIPVPDASDPTPDPALFAVLTAHVRSIDILQLGTRPQLRACFRPEDDFTGQWVAP